MNLHEFTIIQLPWGFPKIRGPVFGVLILRALLFWVYTAAPDFGNYHMIQHISILW